MEPTLCIREHLHKLTVLPSAARTILIEVCELYAIKGQCFAGNQHLAEAACCHPVSVSRHLTWLKKAGLLTIEFEGSDNASRTITPTSELVTAYTLGEVEGLSTLLKGSKQGAKRGLNNVLRGSKQGANHTLVTSELTLDYLVLDTPNVALSTSASANHTPGISGLEAELAQVKAELAKANDRLKKAAEVYHTQQQELETAKQEVTTACQELATVQQENQNLREQLAKKEKRAKRQPAPFAEEMPTLLDWHPEQRAELSSEEQQRLTRFFGWAQDHHLPRVFSRNLTPRKVLYLAKEFSMDALLTVLLEMENSTAFDDKKSADLTAETWLKREMKRQQERERQSEERRYAHVTTTASASYNAYVRRN